MSARCSLVVNGRSVRVSTGDTSLDAAVADGVIAPTQAIHGTAMFGQAGGPLLRRSETRPHRAAEPAPLAILADAPSNLPVEQAAPLPVVRRPGSVTEIRRLAPGVLQAVVTLQKPLDHQPGQQVELSVAGWPPVVMTPSLRTDGSCELNELVFYLACEGGVIAGSLAGLLEVGTPVSVKGSFGRGLYRPGGGRLVLVADEIGFAGIWAIARAARYMETAREQAIVVGARDPLDLYMNESLDWLRATGVQRITLVADRHRQRPPEVRPGPLTAHVPQLRASDVVHVSGRAATVGAVEVLAATVGARCYAIPLDPTL